VYMLTLMQTVENGAGGAEALKEVVTILMRLIELKNPKLYLHSQQVANYAVSTAANMRLPRSEIERIKVAAILRYRSFDRAQLDSREAALFVNPGAERL